MQKQMNYATAMAEIETIVSNLEAGNVTVDDLAARVKRATQLIGVCRAHLRQAGVEVERALAELRDEGATPATAAPVERPPDPVPPPADDDDPFAAF